jgi:hypothetical protein
MEPHELHGRSVPAATELHGVLSEPYPCSACRFRERCAADQLACEKFSMYIAGQDERRWKLAPMAPSRARWESIYGE